MSWTHEPECYVKVRRLSDMKMLGWLGRTDDGFATWIEAGEDSIPANLPLCLKVCWAYETPDPNTVSAETLGDKWYLCAPDYPDGARCWGGKWSNGYGVFWQPALGDGYPLRFERPQQTMDNPVGSICRDHDSQYLHTYDYNGNKMTYGRQGQEAPLAFEFVPVASFGLNERDHWMARLNHVIGDRKISQIILPGSHDAGCWNMTRWGAGLTSRTQSLTIYQQLMAGSRYLDLRAGLSNGTWWMKHNSDWTGTTLQDVAAQMARFLDAHPKEIVLATLLLDSGNDPQFSQSAETGWKIMFDALASHHLDYRKDDGTGFSNIEDVTPNWLTGQKKNLLLFSWGPSTGRVWGTGPGTAMDRNGVYAGDLVLSPGEAVPSDIAQGVDAYTPPAGALWIMHTNTPWGLPVWESLYHKAKLAQPDFSHYFRTRRWGSKRLNIINVDFIGELDWAGPIIDANCL